MFSPSRLNIVASASGHTIWQYRAGKDSLSQIRANGYFLPVVSSLKRGDTVLVEFGTATWAGEINQSKRLVNLYRVSQDH